MCEQLPAPVVEALGGAALGGVDELTGLLIGLCRPYCECDTPVYEL